MCGFLTYFFNDSKNSGLIKAVQIQFLVNMWKKAGHSFTVKAPQCIQLLHTPSPQHLRKTYIAIATWISFEKSPYTRVASIAWCMISQFRAIELAPPRSFKIGGPPKFIRLPTLLGVDLAGYIVSSLLGGCSLVIAGLVSACGDWFGGACGPKG